MRSMISEASVRINAGALVERALYSKRALCLARLHPADRRGVRLLSSRGMQAAELWRGLYQGLSC